MSAAQLLDRLEGVRATGTAKWIARCPAHSDKRPSLGIRETDDGTVLIRCFAECSADSIVHSIGLELRDLFGEKHHGDHGRRAQRPWQAIDLLRVCANEALVVAVAARDMAKGLRVDGDRVSDAARRLLNAVQLAEARP